MPGKEAIHLADFNLLNVAACYSTAPQAVFKIISYGSSPKSLNNLVDYLIDREEGRVEMEGSDGLTYAR